MTTHDDGYHYYISLLDHDGIVVLQDSAYIAVSIASYAPDNIRVLREPKSGGAFEMVWRVLDPEGAVYWIADGDLANLETDNGNV